METDANFKHLPVYKFFLLGACFLGWTMTQMAILVVILPDHVAKMVGDTRKAAALGIMIGFGGIISVLSPPIFGRISDLTQCKLGKRRIYLVIGVSIACLSMVALAFTHIYVVACVFFLLFQFGNNLTFASYVPLFPDMVPSTQIGFASGVFGGIGLLGNGLGAVFGLTAKHLSTTQSYLVVAGILMVLMIVTVLSTQEKSSLPIESIEEPLLVSPEENPVAPKLIPVINNQQNKKRFISYASDNLTWKQFWLELISPLKYHDFRWVFITRLLFQMGLYTIQENLQYYFRDVIHDGNILPKKAVSMWMLPMMVFALITAAIVGIVSDKIGHKRTFVIIASFILACCVTFAPLLPTFKSLQMMAGIFGIGFGMFQSMDFAISVEALPPGTNKGMSLGVWHMSLVAPQMVISPIAGGVLDLGNYIGRHVSGLSHNTGYYVIFEMAALCFILSCLLLRKLKNIK
eukprot:TRINITY_DN542486_c0_g1_i1.p1 TRINITY_DN542486_c0_g1~~TRINITY_DN542486_c0_g1_i1.p1  ORF type:complete len:461 (-),score=81.95 TRINITY_DN542486_c0_g1_i1:324-1706(-)